LSRAAGQYKQCLKLSSQEVGFAQDARHRLEELEKAQSS